MTEPRRCEVKFSHETKLGDFIQFGSAIYFDEGNNALPKTIAIVELDSGQIVEVDPKMVSFLS